MDARMIRATAAVAVLGLLAVAGCDARDRAGGQSADEVTTLTFAQPNDGDAPEQLTAFADEVERAAGGTVRIQFENGWRYGETEYEAGTIEDVRAGKVDLAWVGARAFDTVEITAFQPLLAPLLVDSHDLQGKVFSEGIADEMLSGLEGSGVVGIGVLPGPMRKMLSKADPLSDAAGYAGKNVGIQASAVARQTFQALGATTTDLPSGADISGVDAYEQQVSSIWGNHYEESGASSVVGNLNLWPRPLVVIIGQDAYDGLDESQRSALKDAAAAAVGPALQASRDEDAGSVDNLCSVGIQFPAATPAQLDALVDAVQPVYDAIAAASDENARLLARIQELKAQLAAAPDTVACADTTGTVSGSALPDGTYEKEVTAEEWAAVGWTAPSGTHTLIVEGNTITAKIETGEVTYKAKYELLRDRFHTTDGRDTVDAIVRVDGETITFTEIDTCDLDCQPYHVVWGGSPWTRVPGSAESADLPNGTYEMTVTPDDVRTACPDGVPAHMNPLLDVDETLQVLTIEGNNIRQVVYYGGRGGTFDFGWTGTYRVIRDQIELVEAGGVEILPARWSFDGSQLVLSEMQTEGCDHKAAWTSHPWTKVS